MSEKKLERSEEQNFEQLKQYEANRTTFHLSYLFLMICGIFIIIIPIFLPEIFNFNMLKIFSMILFGIILFVIMLITQHFFNKYEKEVFNNMKEDDSNIKSMENVK